MEQNSSSNAAQAPTDPQQLINGSPPQPQQPTDQAAVAQAVDNVAANMSPAEPSQEQTAVEEPAAEEEKPAEEESAGEGEEQSEDDPADGEAAPEDGVPPPVAPPAEPPPAPEPKESKVRHIVKKALPFVIIVLVLAGAGAGGYFYAHRNDQPVLTAGETEEAQDSIQAAAPVSTGSATLEPICVSGFKPFTNDTFAICHPLTMNLKEAVASGSGELGKRYMFEDNFETLTVQTNYKDNLSKFECVGSKVVKIAGVSAIRYTIKTKTITGSCSSNIDTYATLVSAGNNRPTYLISLRKKNGTYQSDNAHYASIEQSFLMSQ